MQLNLCSAAVGPRIPKRTTVSRVELAYLFKGILIGLPTAGFGKPGTRHVLPQHTAAPYAPNCTARVKKFVRRVEVLGPGGRSAGVRREVDITLDWKIIGATSM